MKSLSIAGVASLWMLFALSSCATHDAPAGKGAVTPRVIQMHIFFKEENNRVTIEKVMQTGGGGPPDVQKQPGNPAGSTLGTLVTYTKNPNCISLDIGGGFYEICF